MAISVFELLRIGIGPSSSHTVGPMRDAAMFMNEVRDSIGRDRLARVRTELFGSLGATGKGHGSDKAVILGLSGEAPETVDTGSIPGRLEQIRSSGRLALSDSSELHFEMDRDLVFHKQRVLPYHPNGMIFSALDAAGELLLQRTYYSVGGGFVVNQQAAGADRIVEDETPLQYPFSTGAGLLEHCA